MDMMKMDLKQEIDYELSGMTVSRELKNKIYKEADGRSGKYKLQRIIRTAAAVLAVIGLTATTAYAGYNLYHRLLVNQEALPELDKMEVVDMTPLNAAKNENGWIEKDYGSYKEIKDMLGVHLLDTRLAAAHPYMQCHIATDNKDNAMITVENYILGDTDGYEYSEEDKCYFYQQGEEYRSPVSLSVSLILSQEQLARGWDTEYMGYYRFVEDYTSAQGSKVNVLEDTVDGQTEHYISEKAAVFVADGIEYTVKGRTSLENIKMIVDSME